MLYAESNDYTQRTVSESTAFKSRKLLTRKRFESFNPSPTIGTNGIIYVASDNGGVYAINGAPNNPLANTAWPKFRHDIKNTGRARGTVDNSLFNKSNLNPIIIWRFNTPNEYEFNSSPALGLDDQGDTVLFIGGVDGYFYCIDAANGIQKWRKKTIYDPTTVPYEPEDLLSASPAVNTYFTPAHIYCGGESGELYCYEASSGTFWKWRFPDSSYEHLTYNEIGSSAAITANSNRLYVGCDDYRLYCLRDDGSWRDTVWTFYTGSEIWSSPAIDDSGNVYFSDDSGYVTSLTPNRTVRWRIRDGRTHVASSPTIGSNAIYIGSDNGYLDALNPNTGSRLWRYTASGGIRSSPVIGTDYTIYFGCNNGKLYALEPASGAPKPNFPIQLSDDEITSTPAIAADGTIIVYTSEDSVFGISPAGPISWHVWLRFRTTVILPNGGEIWYGGSNQIIRWRTNIAGFAHYRLLLSTNSGLTYPDTIADNLTPSETTYNWIVPVINSTTCRVMVQILGTNDSVINQDASNGNFTILALALTSPNGGEVLYGGSNYTIRWQAFGSGFSRYRLLLSTNSGSTYPDTIAHNVALTESTYQWFVPPLNWSTCRVMVQVLDASGVVIAQDASDGNFIIMTNAITENENNNPFFTATLFPIKMSASGQDIIGISFYIAKPQQISLQVYAVSGKLVKTLANAQLDKGMHTYNWNCQDENYRPIAAGIYFYRLQTGKFTVTKKMLRLR
jgi:outer membrane protein assembly factor BamB